MEGAVRSSVILISMTVNRAQTFATACAKSSRGVSRISGAELAQTREGKHSILHIVS